MTWRVGVDVGGTFTDLVATDAGGSIRRFKVATTPKAPEEGLLDALRALLREIDPAQIVQLTHAGTIATNALLGQVHLDLPRVAFVTTEGFRDVLEIGRQARSAVYVLNVRRPAPLARREDRLTVRERIDFDGSVHVALDRGSVDAAVASVAAPLGGDVERTAAGIVALVDAEMAKVLRIVSVERGLDPRDFVLMAFGGGGPLHACALAGDLGMRRVVVPRHPGLFSALGLLAADVRATFSRSLVAPLDATTLAAAHAAAVTLANDARDALRRQGVADAAIRTVAELDARYAGQSFDLTIPFAGDQAALAEAFHQRHERRYGYAARDERVELATVRVTASGSAGAAPRVPASNGSIAGTNGARSGTRRAWDDGAFVDATIYERERLGAGATFAGPAIIEQYDTTTWLPSGWRAQADDAGNLLLERRG